MRLIRFTIPLIAAALASCAAFGGDRRPLSRGPDVAPAEGEAVFTRVNAVATAIELRLKNLAEPERLNPPGYVYIAWVRAGREAEPRNVGRLIVSPDFTGELRALTDARWSELFVTVEATGDAERPTGRRLFWADRH